MTKDDWIQDRVDIDLFPFRTTLASFVHTAVILQAGIALATYCKWLSVSHQLFYVIFIRPSSDGSYYGMMMSVRPSVRPGLRPGLRQSQFSALFSVMLWRIELKFGMSLSCYEHSIKSECRRFPSSFEGVMPLLECFDILRWNFAYCFLLMYYRSSLSVVNIRQFL